MPLSCGRYRATTSSPVAPSRVFQHVKSSMVQNTFCGAIHAVRRSTTATLHPFLQQLPGSRHQGALLCIRRKCRVLRFCCAAHPACGAVIRFARAHRLVAAFPASLCGRRRMQRCVLGRKSNSIGSTIRWPRAADRSYRIWPQKQPQPARYGSRGQALQLDMLLLLIVCSKEGGWQDARLRSMPVQRLSQRDCSAYQVSLLYAFLSALHGYVQRPAALACTSSALSPPTSCFDAR